MESDQEQDELDFVGPNHQAAPGNGAVASLFRVGPARRAVAEQATLVAASPVMTKMPAAISSRTCFVFSVVLFIALGAAGDRPIKRPQQGDLVGHWVGFDNSHPYFYRLNLQANNTGKLVVLLPYPRGEASVYGLRWQVDEKELRVLDISPLTTKAETIACSVTKVDFGRMSIEISGVSNGWKRATVLLNEKSLSEAIIESARHESKAGQK